jgi:Ni/Fe-hydrogenase b-type cytochrome subunit
VGKEINPLIYRHNRVTRLTHWVNALALLILFMSGLQIFNAFPNLHWGSKAEPGEALFSIYATDEDDQVRGYTELFGLRVETTGFLGVQNTEMGPFPRAFPNWLTIPGYFWLAGGRRWHFFFTWVFVLNGLLYVLYNFASGHFSKFLLRPKDIPKLLPMVFYYLRLRRQSPQEGEYNPLQKMAYTSVLVLLVPLVILSGLAMSPQLDAAFHWLPALFGGRQSARTVHFLVSGSFALFTFGHIFMVITSGVLNNMRSMVTGWYREGIVAPTETEALLIKEPIEPMAEGREAIIEEPGSEIMETEAADRGPLELTGSLSKGAVEKPETRTGEEKR